MHSIRGRGCKWLIYYLGDRVSEPLVLRRTCCGQGGWLRVMFDGVRTTHMDEPSLDKVRIGFIFFPRS